MLPKFNLPAELAAAAPKGVLGLNRALPGDHEKQIEAALESFGRSLDHLPLARKRALLAAVAVQHAYLSTPQAAQEAVGTTDIHLHGPQVLGLISDIFEGLGAFDLVTGVQMLQEQGNIFTEEYTREDNNDYGADSPLAVGRDPNYSAAPTPEGIGQSNRIGFGITEDTMTAAYYFLSAESTLQSRFRMRSSYGRNLDEILSAGMDRAIRQGIESRILAALVANSQHQTAYDVYPASGSYYEGANIVEWRRVLGERIAMNARKIRAHRYGKAPTNQVICDPLAMEVLELSNHYQFEVADQANAGDVRTATINEFSNLRATARNRGIQIFEFTELPEFTLIQQAKHDNMPTLVFGNFLPVQSVGPDFTNPRTGLREAGVVTAHALKAYRPGRIATVNITNNTP
ncbi:MAG: hypothetical protein ACE366_16440 [Bradymonadia bacterium]